MGAGRFYLTDGVFQIKYFLEINNKNIFPLKSLTSIINAYLSSLGNYRVNTVASVKQLPLF